MKKNWLVIVDIIVFALSMAAAITFFYIIKFGRSGLEQYLLEFWWVPALAGLVRYTTFRSMKIYQLAWRYASIKELIGLLKAIFLSSAFLMAILLRFFILKMT